MAKPEIPLKGGLEYDVLTGWRRVLCYTHNNSSIIKWAKRKYHKRVRREQKKKLINIVQ